MEVSSRITRIFALCAVALFIVLSDVRPVFAIDAEELQALQAITAYYPQIGAHWGPLTLDICNPGKTIPDDIKCLDGHISTLVIGLATSVIDPPTGPLGNISGLHSLASLTLAMHPSIPNFDEWYRQLPSITALYIFTSTRPLIETCTLDFTNNPKLEFLRIYDDFDGAQFASKIVATPSLVHLVLTMRRANQFGADSLLELSLERLQLFAQRGADFPSYTHMTRLMSLYISAPEMTLLPSTFGSLANLRAFVCWNCHNLIKLPASTSSLSLLTQISCDGCKLNQPDSIPALDGTSLFLLDLRRNGIVTLPLGLCHLTPTAPGVSLSLEDNPLTSLPSCWANNTSIRSLALDRAKFTSFPAVIPSLSRLQTLLMLDVYTLGQSGATLPDLSAIQSLVQIDLTNCGLSGAFPTSALRDNRVNFIRLSGNRLTGELPTDFFARTVPAGYIGLTEFAIAGNSLSGPFPPFYPGCRLTDLLIGGNKFTFYDSSIKNCSDITTLDVSGNEWTNLPQVEELATSFRALKSLNVSFNPSLTAVDSRVPQFIWGPSNYHLKTFNGSGCGYSGDLSGFTSQVQVLDLSHNNLSGSTSHIFSVGQVSTLILSNNKLSGDFLPDDWIYHRFPVRLHLDISNNLLTGAVLTSSSSWHWLQVFKASNNNFTGPVFISLPSDLETFWVDGNSFDMCPPPTTMPDLQSCRMGGENQRVDDCDCSDFYFRKQCTLNTDCTPPPIDPPIDPPSHTHPGSPFNPNPNPNPETPSPTSPPTSSVSPIAVSSIMTALALLGSLLLM